MIDSEPRSGMRRKGADAGVPSDAMVDVDLASRSGISPYSGREKACRVLWNYLGQTLFRLTFHNWYGLRNMLLRLFGASIGPRVRIRPTVLVEEPWNLSIAENSCVGDRSLLYCLGRVTIGRNVSISQGVHLCAGSHDHTRADMPLTRPPIMIEDSVWIAADAFIGPNVRVGEGAILGARGCAFRSLDPWTIYGGNPARRLRARERPVGLRAPCSSETNS